MKKKLLFFTLTILCLLCVCGFTAANGHTTRHIKSLSYPVCSACGSSKRIFTHIADTSTHSVSCKQCGNELMTENCYALTDATCNHPSTCVCDNVLQPPTAHQFTVMAMNEYTHDQVCTLSDCSCNPFSAYFTASYQSFDHTYTGYTYRDFRHSTTGARHHSRVRYCTECGYEDYDTIPCGYTFPCPGRAICFHEAENG